MGFPPRLVTMCKIAIVYSASCPVPQEGSSSVTSLVTIGCFLLMFLVVFWFWNMGIRGLLLFFRSFFRMFLPSYNERTATHPSLWWMRVPLSILIRIFPSPFLVFMMMFLFQFFFAYAVLAFRNGPYFRFSAVLNIYVFVFKKNIRSQLRRFPFVCRLLFVFGIHRAPVVFVTW